MNSCTVGLRRSRSRVMTTRHSRISQSAFSLAELLVAVAIAGIASAAAGTALLAHIRSVGNFEQAQRQRDNAGRLDYLIQIETGEAAIVRTGGAMVGCKGAGLALVALEIPRSEGGYQDPLNNSFIYYYNDSGDVRRCGPPVGRNGVLNHDPSVNKQDGVAVRDATLELVSCLGESSNERQLAYRLVFQSGFQPGCSVARARTIRVN